MSLPSWQETFAALHRAQSAEELWAVLVTPHGIGSSSAWEEPFVLFRRFHKSRRDGATVTALLLCTDHRWRGAAHQLIAQLADSGILDDDDLDALAAAFVPAHATLTAVGGESIERPVFPPLRRWAATRLVKNDGSAWRALLDLAATEPSRDGAALAMGVMDAADAIPPDDRSPAIEVGMAWGSGVVRLAALPALATLIGDEAAIERARTDTNAKVRRWSPPPTRFGAEPAPGEPRTAVEAAVGDSRQPNLSDDPPTPG